MAAVGFLCTLCCHCCSTGLTGALQLLEQSSHFDTFVFLIFLNGNNFKGIPLRFDHVTHQKRKFSKTFFFLLLTCVGHISLSCDTLIHLKLFICLFWKSVSTLFLFNRYIPILNQIAKSIKDILRYHKVNLIH